MATMHQPADTPSPPPPGAAGRLRGRYEAARRRGDLAEAAELAGALGAVGRRPPPPAVVDPARRLARFEALERLLHHHEARTDGWLDDEAWTELAPELYRLDPTARCLAVSITRGAATERARAAQPATLARAEATLARAVAAGASWRVVERARRALRALCEPHLSPPWYSPHPGQGPEGAVTPRRRLAALADGGTRRPGPSWLEVATAALAATGAEMSAREILAWNDGPGGLGRPYAAKTPWQTLNRDLHAASRRPGAVVATGSRPGRFRTAGARSGLS